MIDTKDLLRQIDHLWNVNDLSIWTILSLIKDVVLVLDDLSRKNAALREEIKNARNSRDDLSGPAE